MTNTRNSVDPISASSPKSWYILFSSSYSRNVSFSAALGTSHSRVRYGFFIGIPRRSISRTIVRTCFNRFALVPKTSPRPCSRPRFTKKRSKSLINFASISFIRIFSRNSFKARRVVSYPFSVERVIFPACLRSKTYLSKYS